MRVGNFKIWRPQIVCWGVFLMCSVLATIFIYTGMQPTKSATVPLHHYVLVILGAVLAIDAVLLLILARRAIKRGHNEAA